jgi:RNA-directed DNA polymerase
MSYYGYVKILKHYKKHEINALHFLTADEAYKLCVLLRTPFYDLENQINNPVYRQFGIRKSRGGKRDIASPDKQLKLIQRRLNYYLQAYYLCIKPAEVHGFVIHPKYLGDYCNIVANAQPHTRKKHVLNIDLQDFFPSITARQVRDLFASSMFDFDYQVSTALALLTTYNGKLPTGAPTSPVISNLICLPLDNDLKSFADENQLAFTRYADDLTFSSEAEITKDNLLDIINIIQHHGFRINEKKLRFKSSSHKQTVTGLIVNEKVNIDRKMLKKTRAMIHDLTTNGLERATRHHFGLSTSCDERMMGKFLQRIQGYINFIGQVRGQSDPMYLKFKYSIDETYDLP